MQFLDLTGVQSLWDAVKTRVENSKTLVSGQSTHATNPYIGVTSQETETSNGSHYSYYITVNNVVSPTDLQVAKEALYGTTIPASGADTISGLANEIDTLTTNSAVTVTTLATPTAGYLASYQIAQGGTVLGTINIPKDFLVKSGSVRAATATDHAAYPDIAVGDKVLDFVVNTYTSDGTDTHIIVPVRDLVDVYTGGDGITVSNANVIAIEIDNASENFLSVSSNGLKLSGVQTAINTAKSDVIGTNSDTASSDTIKGAKKYADSLAGNYATAAQGALADTALQRVDTTQKGTNVKVNLGLDSTDSKKVIVSVNETGLTNALDSKADKITNGKTGNFVSIDSTGNIVDSGSNSNTFASAEQGAAADSAVKDVQVSAAGGQASSVVNSTTKVATINVAEGATNGTISVNSTDVAVHGLGSAAYTNSSAYATSNQGAAADSAIQTINGEAAISGGNSSLVSVTATKGTGSNATTYTLASTVKLQDIGSSDSSTATGIAEASNVKAYVGNVVGGLDSNQTYAVSSGAASAANGTTKTSYAKVLTSVKVTETDGKLTAPASGDVVEVAVDKAGAAKAAYDDLLGTNGDAVNTRTIEGLYSTIASITGGGGSVETQITNAINALDSSVAGTGTASGDNKIATDTTPNPELETQTAQYVLTKVVIVNGKLDSASTAIKIEGIPSATLSAIFVDTPSGN